MGRINSGLSKTHEWSALTVIQRPASENNKILIFDLLLRVPPERANGFRNRIDWSIILTLFSCIHKFVLPTFIYYLNSFWTMTRRFENHLTSISIGWQKQVRFPILDNVSVKKKRKDMFLACSLEKLLHNTEISWLTIKNLSWLGTFTIQRQGRR